MSEHREKLWYILNYIAEIGPVTTQKLIEYTGDIEELMELSTDELRESNILNDKMLRAWNDKRPMDDALIRQYEENEAMGMHFASIESENYPERLKNIPGHPYGIHYIGRNANDYARTASIIGSRGCTGYGRELATEIGKRLSRIGVCVISGMALGIDAAGQWGALNAGGASVGVLGGGVDVCYPRENMPLYERLMSDGSIISEQPCGCPALPTNFRLRNRIISGLSDCVIVVEARKKSGTQITVSYALDQGRDIFCVPGRLTDPLSAGCNEMISQGARILHDFSELAQYFESDDLNVNVARNIELSPAEMLVYEKLTDDLQHIEDLLMATGLPVADLMSVLLNLEIKGVVHQQIKNYFRRCVRL
ncbi:MAG: DNA-processing protein DprA [Lachnospiraceae bacterium]|nr:DNA-processing protein DprA [Lachnospiraceae bacterium]